MLPTTILQWALNSVVCNFTCNSLLGQWGQPTCIWHDNLHTIYYIQSLIRIHFRTWHPCHQPCNPQAHGHSWPMQHDVGTRKNAVWFAKLHPTNRSDPRVILRISMGSDMKLSRKLILVYQLFGAKMTTVSSKERDFSKRNGERINYINSSTGSCSCIYVCWQLSLLLGLWVQWLLRPTLLKWQHIDTLPGGKARRKKLSLGGFELQSLLVKEFPLDLWIKQTNDFANDNSVVNSHHHTDMPRHIDLNLSNDLDRTVAQGVISSHPTIL